MKSLRQRVAIKMSDIQRTVYEGESCFNIDPHSQSAQFSISESGLKHVIETQQCFLKLADKVIAMVKKDMKKKQKLTDLKYVIDNSSNNIRIKE